MLSSEQNPSLRSGQATATMLSRIVAVQVCDAKDDDSSTIAGYINTLFISFLPCLTV